MSAETPRVPRTVEQATALAARYAALDGERAAAEAQRHQQIGQINAAADVVVTPLVEQMEAIATKLEPWWAKNASALTKGKRKSVELGGCMIGSRAARARLAHGYDSDELALAALVASRYRNATVQLKYAIDRAATLKLLDAGGAGAKGLSELGFRSETPAEGFYINRVEQSGAIGA